MQTRLNTEILGEGKTPLLMIHGWGRDLTSLKPLGILLAQKYKIHLIDLPGFGKSDRQGKNWGVEEYGEELLDYCACRKIERFHFLGHSLGGRIGLYLGAHAPEKIERLVLIASAGLKRKATLQGMLRQKVIASTAKATKFWDHTFQTAYFLNWFTPRFGSPDYKNAGEMRPSLIKILKRDLEREAALVKAPALLLWGKEDPETPLEMGKRLHALIKESRLLTFPHKGHAPFEGVGHHLLARYIFPFLSGGR